MQNGHVNLLYLIGIELIRRNFFEAGGRNVGNLLFAGKVLIAASECLCRYGISRVGKKCSDETGKIGLCVHAHIDSCSDSGNLV